MERVRKTYFNPLARSKLQIQKLLHQLPLGSAHPFSPENTLLCHTESGIQEIDISSYPQDFFYNAVDLGEMGEVLLRRMAGFRSHLSVFEDFQIAQAPASTFSIPIVSNQITIFAVSERTPTYYDFCFADAACNTCCWLAQNTFPGITHSGDIHNGNDLLDYVKISKDTLTEMEVCVFISGYQKTAITRFLGTHPALLVADHVEKVLYTIPVPLDAVTIGDATICCPLVIRRDGDNIICSILPRATTDRNMMCSSSKLSSPAFAEAIASADFSLPSATTGTSANTADEMDRDTSGRMPDRDTTATARQDAVFVTSSVTVPSAVDISESQIIQFGTGIEFKAQIQEDDPISTTKSVILPCVFGTTLEGPLLLATGTTPSNVPFEDHQALHDYYKSLNSAVFIVDDRMTDNSRTLAGSYRINAVFVVQPTQIEPPPDADAITTLLNSVNINSITALAGPQSLILVQIVNRFYFYRGIANRTHLNTSQLVFAEDLTAIVEAVGLRALAEPRASRLCNLDDGIKTILMVTSGKLVRANDLLQQFRESSVDQIHEMEENISASVPQLQTLFNEKDLQELSQALVSALSVKVGKATEQMRDAYVNFLKNDYKMGDPESQKQKNAMLGELRKMTKAVENALAPAISNLSSLISARSTSKRTHDLKRLVRQAQIKGNVEAAMNMTFDTLAGYLETYAGDMGVMVLNIATAPYKALLGSLAKTSIDASDCCELDSRILYLDGLDAGIIMEQSQGQHSGPLRSQSGPLHPILALPYLNQGAGTGSMLAWVCWDEFVNLENPYTVRWMEKCNAPHIAALRIIMRSTLSTAAASREHDMQPSSPETGRLMAALLMAAMSKLAAMRQTTPVVVDKAEDTVTKLMRGLFGNLLTIAGSGVRPMSLVWQLFGENPQLDIPTNDHEWIWYENVVALYPYTGWPLVQFHDNLNKLLDKAIVRVVTKGETVVKAGRVAEMMKYCKLRNIQLEQSRTIITIFMRMLTDEAIDKAAASKRLLAKLPEKLEKQTQGYTRMIKYLHHLADGGGRLTKEDLNAANIYSTRSGAFSAVKARAAQACRRGEWAEVKEACQELLKQQLDVTNKWQVDAGLVQVQNIRAYKSLLDASFAEDVDPVTRSKNLELTRQVLSDAETKRVPWQVGKEGEFGPKIEELDEAFLYEILTGEVPNSVNTLAKPLPDDRGLVVVSATTESDIQEALQTFKSSLDPQLVNSLQTALSAEDACSLMKIPPTTMRCFVRALNPEFIWDDLGARFVGVILDLLRNRSNRIERQPVRRLLGLGGANRSIQNEG